MGAGQSPEKCAEKVIADGSQNCEGTRFDFNSGYNGQCKCLAKQDPTGCDTFSSSNGYNVYEIQHGSALSGKNISQLIKCVELAFRNFEK